MSRAGLGHNQGPTMESGKSWRKHCWTHARRQLLPQLPLEVVRQRVRRAAEIGMDYRTYATVRATTGTDIVAFLFSNNALQVFRTEQALSEARAQKLRAVQNCEHMLAVHAPLTPQNADHLLAKSGVKFDHIADAPRFAQSWSQTADQMREMMAQTGLSPKSVLVIGETTMEREWSQAGRLAGFVTGQSYFAPRA